MKDINKVLTLAILGGLIESTLFYHFEHGRSMISYIPYFISLVLFAIFIISQYDLPLWYSLPLLHLFQDFSHVIFHGILTQSGFNFWIVALLAYPIDLFLIGTYHFQKFEVYRKRCDRRFLWWSFFN